MQPGQLLYPSKAPRTPPVIGGEVEEDEEAWHLPPSLGVYEKYWRRVTQYVCLLGNVHATKEVKRMEESSGHEMVSVYRHWMEFMVWDDANLWVPATVLKVSCIIDSTPPDELDEVALRTWQIQETTLRNTLRI